MAIATPPGVGGIGIVRASGPRAHDLVITLTGRAARPRRAELRVVCDAGGRALDRGLVLYFPAPHSFTGEDVVEFQVHGGQRLLEAVLAACLARGARLARPGEFTLRALENGRLDLVEAEAIADLTAARSEAELRLAAKHLTGGFSESVARWRQVLVDVVAELAAGVDYPEEVELSETRERAWDAYARLVAEWTDVLAAGTGARAVRQGVRVAIVGPPNAGKSTLFNALVGYERAIVSDVAGTTRDTVEEEAEIGGIRFRFIDTAGLRDALHVDPVERAGVARARAALRTADVVLAVADARAARPAEVEAGPPLLRVAQKADLLARGAVVPWADVVVSARRGDGLAQLRQMLVGLFPGVEDVATANQRHLGALARARDSLAAPELAEAPVELLLQAGEDALAALGEITGEKVTEAVLTEIFSRFCLGK